MVTRHLSLVSLAIVSVSLVGCAATTDGPGEDVDNTAEAATAPVMPTLVKGGAGVQGRGLPVLFGVGDDADGSHWRTVVFLETSTPDGPDTEGHPRFVDTRYQKRLIHVLAAGEGPVVTTPTDGVKSGAQLISSDEDDGGKVRGPVLASANNEIKKLWTTHTGRFTIKMFPAQNNVAHTANGYTTSLGAAGKLTASDGNGSTFTASSGLATLEEMSSITNGVEAVSRCKYVVTLKEAAVLKSIASVAIFHVQRDLVGKTGTDIACTKSEDRYVFATP